jgi:Fibronectin type III domain
VYPSNPAADISGLYPAGTPSAPSDLTATPTADGTIGLNWSPPAGDLGIDPLTGYTVTAAPGGFSETVSASQTTATVGGLTDGTSYTFSVTATNDVATGPAAQATGVPSSPTSVVLPANGATVGGTQQVLDAAASSGTSQVEFEISGGTLTDDIVATATPTIYGWIALWNTTTVPNGTYSLQSLARSGGNGAVSAPITITVNNAAPTTYVAIPSNGTTVGGTQILDAGASSGVTSVQYEVTGGSLTNDVIAAATATIYGWLAEFNTTIVPNGTYTLQSVATYRGGVSGASAGITITVNNAAPTSSVVIPTSGTKVSGSSQVLDAAATSGVTSVVFEVTGGSLTNSVVATATATAYGWIALWNTKAVPDGSYILKSVASYAGGVSGTSPGETVTVAN